MSLYIYIYIYTCVYIYIYIYIYIHHIKEKPLRIIHIFVIIFFSLDTIFLKKSYSNKEKKF